MFATMGIPWKKPDGHGYFKNGTSEDIKWQCNNEK